MKGVCETESLAAGALLGRTGTCGRMKEFFIWGRDQLGVTWEPGAGTSEDWRVFSWLPWSHAGAFVGDDLK